MLVGFTYFCIAGVIMGVGGVPEISGWPMFAVLGGASAVGTAGLYKVVRQTRRRAEALHGSALEVTERPWVKHARRVRFTLLHTFLVSWLCLFWLSTPSGQLPHGHPVIWVMLASGFGALLLAALPYPPKSEAHRREHAQVLAVSAEPVSAELSKDLISTVERLARIHDEVERKTRAARDLTAWFDSHIRPEYDRVHAERAREAERRGNRRQWMFLLLGFLLGFVVNWTSAPILNAIIK